MRRPCPASYQNNVCISINGIGPWLWIPLANKYGRRPIYLFSTILGFASILGCACTETFGQLIAARVIDGFFPVAFALGAATVVDLFFYHQRGRAMGFFDEFFHWDTLVTGLAYGGALTIGGCLGELAAGWVVDLIVKREREKTGRDPEPKVRLRAIWIGEILVPTRLLIYGFCVQYHTVWIAPILGMGIACFGLQVIKTCTYTCAIDCYRTEGSEVAHLFNFIRQDFGFAFAFYVVRMGTAIGYQWTFLFIALVGGYTRPNVEGDRMKEEVGKAKKCQCLRPAVERSK